MYVYTVYTLFQAGYTAVMYAVKGDHVGIVRELLLAGADPTVRNKVHVHILLHITSLYLH